MLALIFTANALPMIIGSLSGWLWLAGITARPRATSSRTSSAGTPSRAAMNAISAVISPARARCSWVPRSRTTPGRGGSPACRSITACGVGVRARGVVQVEVLAVGQVHPPERHPGTVGEFAVDLRAARDRAGGHRRSRTTDISVILTSPYAGITRSGSYGRQPQPSSQRTGCALPRVDVCRLAQPQRVPAGIGIAPRCFV